MCFSSTASFVSSAVLMTAGIASVRSCKSFSQRWFAAIPLLFGIQQFFEGIVWRYLGDAEYLTWNGYGVKIFLFFAIVVWPSWVPWSVLKIETHLLRRRLVIITLFAGLIFSAVALTMLFIYPSQGIINGHHIDYELEFPLRWHPLATLVYLSATLLPLIVSSAKYVPVLGGIIFTSYVVTFYFYSAYIISVWCFFAAIISALIYLMISGRIKSFSDPTK
jgi:hypothetical protein